MSTQEFLAIWLCTFAVVLACRVVPIFALRGRSLPQGAVRALGYIPPAAFAALVANDLFSPATLTQDPKTSVVALLAAAVTVAVARMTRSMLWCCVIGVVAYVLLGLI